MTRKGFYREFFELVSEFDDRTYGSESEIELCDWWGDPPKKPRRKAKNKEDLVEEVEALAFY